MRSLHNHTKMEAGRRRKPFLDTRPLISFVLFSLIFLSFLCSPSSGEDILTSNSNETVLLPKSVTPPSCTFKTTNGKYTAYCDGYLTIPTNLKEKETINSLDMSGGNHLQTLTKGQLREATLPALQNLNLENCQIRTIERGAFEGGENIIHLDLSRNRIEVLDPQVFAGMVKLRTLKLTHNRVNRFQTDSVFPPLPSLTHLDLSSCDIDSVPVGAFDNLMVLKKLQLNDNDLYTLDWRVIKKVPYLETLDLSGNPWHCDCKVKFVIEVIEEKGIIGRAQKPVCKTSPERGEEGLPPSPEWNLEGSTWDSVKEKLICPARIHELKYLSYDVLPISNSVDHEQDHDHIDYQSENEKDEPGKVKLGQDVYFECEYSGYPPPQITWLKDDKQINLQQLNQRASDNNPSPNESSMLPESQPETGEHATNGTAGQPSSSSPTSRHSPELKPKMEFQDAKFELEKNMDEEEKKRNFKFKESLVIRRVEAADRGTYICVVQNVGSRVSRGLFLNMTVPGEDLFLGGIGGKKRVAVWMWILIGILCSLILILLMLLICLAWRRKEKKKQEGFRKVIQEKFKDSNIDLGEIMDIKPATTQHHPQARDGSSHPDGTTPLLDNHSESSTILISDHFPPQKAPQLPDVALGNGELAIYSSKPPMAQNGRITPDEARREFFARQISEPYLRPASAMSIGRPPHLNAAQKRYVFANSNMYQSEPVPGVHGQEPLYDQIRTLPRSGSAMSMSAIPEQHLRRQIYMRQNSQPFYATASRLPQHRRNPSVSSEPPQEYGAFNYSTLPRRPVKFQNWSRPVSPTGSTCSTYSTLSWRPYVNPATGVISDGVGPRRGADGGSTLSLNKTPDSLQGSTSNLSSVGGGGGGLESMSRAMMMTPTQVNGGGKVKSLPRNARMGHTRTPSSLTRGHNDFFSFEPIQEVEGSEFASTSNLDKAGGRQTPQGYSTQSLARGEPRYKKKKPPPLRAIPTHLKEPSGTFDHLKARSTSPAFRNGVGPNETSHSDKSKIEEAPKLTSPKEPIIIEDLSIRKNKLVMKNGDRLATNGVQKDMPPVLESPIDEESQDKVQSLQAPQLTKLPSKTPPPPPPPKPKRNPQALEGGSQDNLNAESDRVDGAPASGDTGTVV